MLPEGGCTTPETVVRVLNTYIREGYLETEEAQRILREWEILSSDV